MSRQYKVTIRTEGKVETLRLSSLDSAINTLVERLQNLIPYERRRQSLGYRVFEGESLVIARGEITTPRRRRFRRVHGGVDVRGDRTTLAWIGRVRKRTVAAEMDETTYQALQRAISIAEGSGNR